MPDVPEIPITAIDEPSSTDLTDPTNTYPLLETIQGPPNADSVGPEAANRQPRALDTRTETLRTTINQLINVANALTANLLHRDGQSANPPSSMLGDLDMTDSSQTPAVAFQIKNMADATDDDDAVTKQQLDALETFLDGLQVQLNGTLLIDGTRPMAANLDVGNNQVINMADPVNAQDGVNKQTLDASVTSITATFVLRTGANPMTGNLDMGGNKVVNLDTAAPVNAADAVSFSYLQTIISQVGVTPPGTLVWWGGVEATVPAGWLLCDGREVSRTNFAALFGAIGETYGVGDTTTTFNLPDGRGRALMGKDNMGGLSANVVTDAQADVLGGTLGDEEVTLTTNELPSHSHSFNDQYIDGDAGGAAQGPATQNSTSTLAVNASTTGFTGGGLPHNNVQPTITLNLIVKT